MRERKVWRVDEGRGSWGLVLHKVEAIHNPNNSCCHCRDKPRCPWAAAEERHSVIELRAVRERHKQWTLYRQTQQQCAAPHTQQKIRNKHITEHTPARVIWSCDVYFLEIEKTAEGNAKYNEKYNSHPNMLTVGITLGFNTCVGLGLTFFTSFLRSFCMGKWERIIAVFLTMHTITLSLSARYSDWAMFLTWKQFHHFCSSAHQINYVVRHGSFLVMLWRYQLYTANYAPQPT